MPILRKMLPKSQVDRMQLMSRVASWRESQPDLGSSIQETWL